MESVQAAPVKPFAYKAVIKRLVIVAGVITLLAVMMLDTRVIYIGSDQDIRERAFSPELYGQSEFIRIQRYILDNAVDAEVLYSALLEDKTSATEKYGVEAGIGAIFPLAFEGIAGEAKSGVYQIQLDGFPGHTIRLQTGPAINGTDLRDATGTITFGQFTNQIEYQDAGSALNKAMKSAVLADIDVTALTGKQLSVVGVFKLINPKNWLVTPVRLVVK